MYLDYFSRKNKLKGGVLTNYNFLGISCAPNDDSISMLKVVKLECSRFNSNKYKLHCLDRDLNDKRPGASSDNNFIFKKKKLKNKYKREKQILWAFLDLPANQHSQSSLI